MSTSLPETDASATDLCFDDDSLWVDLADGRILTFSGDPGANTVEVFDVAVCITGAGAIRMFSALYPCMHLLPTGDIFYSRTGWNGISGSQNAYLRLTGPETGNWTDFGTLAFPDRQEGMSLAMIDTTVTPVQTKIFIFGGGAVRFQNV